MSRTRKYNDKYQNEESNRRGGRRQRRLSVRGLRREDPDLRRIGKALVAFTLAEAEADAEQRMSTPNTPRPSVDENEAEECA